MGLNSVEQACDGSRTVTPPGGMTNLTGACPEQVEVTPNICQSSNIMGKQSRFHSVFPFHRTSFIIHRSSFLILHFPLPANLS